MSEALTEERTAASDAAKIDRSIVGFFCRECAYAAADATGNARISIPTTIRSVLVPVMMIYRACSSRDKLNVSSVIGTSNCSSR